MRQPERLGGDHGAEVELLAHQHVGPPGAAERQHGGRSLAADAAHEVVADRPHVSFQVDGRQR